MKVHFNIIFLFFAQIFIVEARDYGYRLKSHVIKAYDNAGIKWCAIECVSRTNCVSYNFKKELFYCELNKIRKEDSLKHFVIADGYFYEDSLKNATDHGSHSTCLPNHKSVKLRNGETRCIRTGTPPFTISFTSCGSTGPTGPTLSGCLNVYPYVWPRNQINFNVADGIQEWTIPEAAYYVIDAYGAQGGTGNLDPTTLGGGKGAKIRGTFFLTSSTVLNIVVGQRGTDGGTSEPGGGGGCTFVYTGIPGGTGLLIAAGGGGGAGEEGTHPGHDGTGTNFASTASGPVGSVITGYGGFGYGGAGGNVTSAGAGWYSNGGSHQGTDIAYPGLRWQGGQAPASVGGGGFGGGGSGVSTHGGGGGGGYTGGPGISSPNRLYWGGCGGGSFNGGTNQTNVTGFNSGNGMVIVTKL